jgi:hypothetical protein
MVFLFLSQMIASAQNEPPQTVEADLEITVWGDHAIKQARAAIIRDMEDMGYKPVDRPEGLVVFRPPKTWMGRVSLDVHGDLSFGRPVIAYKSAQLHDSVHNDDNPNLGDDPGGLAYPVDGGEYGWTLPSGEAGLWVLPAWRLLTPIHARVRERLAPRLRDYKDVVELTESKRDERG